MLDTHHCKPCRPHNRVATTAPVSPRPRNNVQPKLEYRCLYDRKGNVHNRIEIPPCHAPKRGTHINVLAVPCACKMPVATYRALADDVKNITAVPHLSVMAAHPGFSASDSTRSGPSLTNREPCTTSPSVNVIAYPLKTMAHLVQLAPVVPVYEMDMRGGYHGGHACVIGKGTHPNSNEHPVP